MNFILETKNLTRTVSQSAIIDNFTFSFERHQIYNILGPSGAGKSSLLRLLNRLDEPTDGEILFNEKAQCDYSPSELRTKVGYLFQTPFLFPKTVKDNLLYAAPDLADSEMDRILEQTQMSADFLERPVDNLSIGEQQRIAFGRLLAMNPEVLLLDEPTSALDPANTEGIENLIRSIASQGQQTVIMVTHNPEQALRIGGQAILLVKGQLIESGSVEDIVMNPGTEIGRQYKDKRLK